MDLGLHLVDGARSFDCQGEDLIGVGRLVEDVEVFLADLIDQFIELTVTIRNIIIIITKTS